MQSGQANWSGGPQGSWSSGAQGNWSSRQQEGNWGYRHQGPQPSNSGRQPNNQVVSYVPPHQRGNQQHPGNQQHHQPQYHSEYYGPSDFPQPGHGGGHSNQRYNRHPNEGPGEIMAPHHPNDEMREIQEAQKEQRAALDMLTKQLSQVAMSLGELRGNEGKIPATLQPTGQENISKVSLRLGKVYQSHSSPAMSPASIPGPSQEEEGESSSSDQAARAKDKGKAKMGGETSEEGQGEEMEKVKPYPYRGMVTRKRDTTIDVASLFKDVEVKVPLLTALKMPPISQFIKDYLAGKVNEEGRIIT
ncbi:glutenin, high molecular weight subunit DY10-like [Salvia splendens]|uniref:glutenin, high molecular weight subunit DY10-like n=1 Tax=Salvia splendens TaxID=180675 RepID=UPI001C263370|nr:glutenin, high molecular weight subunit DY10-like [Salvia splendens]